MGHPRNSTLKTHQYFLGRGTRRRARDDPAALYRRLSAQVTFADGNPASYGFGLGRSTEFGRPVTGHGGALRGWRSHRMYVPSERVSVVVLFNHNRAVFGGPGVAAL